MKLMLNCIRAHITVQVGQKKKHSFCFEISRLDFRGISTSVVFVTPIIFFFKHVCIASCWVHPMLTFNTVSVFAFSLLTWRFFHFLARHEDSIRQSMCGEIFPFLLWWFPKFETCNFWWKDHSHTLWSQSYTVILSRSPMRSNAGVL